MAPLQEVSDPAAVAGEEGVVAKLKTPQLEAGATWHRSPQTATEALRLARGEVVSSLKIPQPGKPVAGDQPSFSFRKVAAPGTLTERLIKGALGRALNRDALIDAAEALIDAEPEWGENLVVPESDGEYQDEEHISAQEEAKLQEPILLDLDHSVWSGVQSKEAVGLHYAQFIPLLHQTYPGLIREDLSVNNTGTFRLKLLLDIAAAYFDTEALEELTQALNLEVEAFDKGVAALKPTITEGEALVAALEEKQRTYLENARYLIMDGFLG